MNTTPSPERAQFNSLGRSPRWLVAKWVEALKGRNCERGGVASQFVNLVSPLQGFAHFIGSTQGCAPLRPGLSNGALAGRARAVRPREYLYLC